MFLHCSLRPNARLASSPLLSSFLSSYSSLSLLAFLLSSPPFFICFCGFPALCFFFLFRLSFPRLILLPPTCGLLFPISIPDFYIYRLHVFRSGFLLPSGAFRMEPAKILVMTKLLLACTVLISCLYSSSSSPPFSVPVAHFFAGFFPRSLFSSSLSSYNFFGLMYKY